MFDPTPGARLFAVPPGADFPQVLAQGFRARMAGQPPEAMARVEVIVNTARMQTRLREALIAQGPGFLPQIRLIADLAADEPAEPALRARLALAQAIRALLRRQPDLGPSSAAFSLAESLFRLLDEMQGEGVPMAMLDRLDVSNHSEHWTRALHFIRLIAEHFGPLEGGQARLRTAVERLIAGWALQPPAHPVIVAGSTGSRGPSALLMQAVARLPQGALVLPGFDDRMPVRVWHGLEDPLHSEDHPQFRYARLMATLGVDPGAVPGWITAPPPDPARNALISLALRPAPVTDQWLSEGAGLGDLVAATQNLSLIEAPSQRHEALAIALCLRQAAVDGRKAALITPDRTLARRVTAALDRWQLRPDDSAGRPLMLSAPGRFLRQCAEVMTGRPSAEGVIALLKHPITHSATDRGEHLRHLRDLELHLRRRAIPYPDAAALSLWAARKEDRQPWADWLIAGFAMLPVPGQSPLRNWVEGHLRLASHLARGVGGADDGELWKEAAGEAARALLDDLLAQADYGGDLSESDYFALSETVFAGPEVRETVESHPGIMVWGTLEARAQGADLVILGGLVEGTWPAATQPDPWFNRQMRVEAGLLLPERQIGLSAHDFQQAVAAPEVVLTRSLRSAEAETVPSRWLNRLTNLVNGLPAQGGDRALAAMKRRGRRWLDLATALEADLGDVPEAARARAPRPAPAPPVSTRPNELPVTRIETLIRDPYAIYAEHVLGLADLDPLAPEADARLRGTVLHKVFDAYVRAHPPGTPGSTDALLAIAETILAEECPWNAVRLHWLALLGRSAKAFVAWNAGLDGAPVLAEEKGRMVLDGFGLIGKPDRIDRAPDGALSLYDYKTGALPSKPQQEAFSKQLILLGLMAEAGAFKGLDPAPVTTADYVGVGAAFRVTAADVTPDNLTKHRAELEKLIRAYRDPSQGFTAMRAVKEEGRAGPYDALSRRGEWQPTDPARRIDVGDRDG